MRTSLRNHNTKSYLMLAAGATAVLAAASAQAQVRKFDVAEQPAVTGIPQFGKQAELQILAPQGAVQGKRVNAVRGELKPFKATIEARFESVKQETESRARLSEASAAWTERVAGDVAAVARAFPPQATEKLRACAVAASGRYP